MKSLFVKLGLVAVVAFLGFSCGKDKGEVPQEKEFTRTVTVSLSKGADTKTSLVEGTDKVSFLWTEGDDAYFLVTENGNKGTVDEVVFSEDMRKATLTVSFATSSEESYEYQAKFAKEFSNHKNAKLSATQYPSATSYDPSCDILLSDPITRTTAATSLQFAMTRKVAVNKMTLTGLKPGEKINEVVLELNKIVAGTFNESTGEFDGSDKILTLKYSGFEVPDSGEFPVYFTCAPVSEATIANVIVTTDNIQYRKPAAAFSKKLTLVSGKTNKFSMDMTGYDTPISDGKIYTLVESQSDLTDGATYIIAAKDQDAVMGRFAGGTSTIHPSVTVAKSSDKKTITVNDAVASSVLPVTISTSESNYVIKNAAAGDSFYGQYLAWTSGNTSIEQESAYKWSISISGGVATVKSVKDATRQLQYNSTNPRFCCYTSSQQSIALYKEDGSDLPLGISFAESSYTFILGSDDYTAFHGQTVTKASADTRTVTYNMTGDAIGSIDASSGAVTLNNTKIGTATVTASVDADETHKAGSVSYTIAVTAPTGPYDLLNNSFIGVTGKDYLDNSGLDGSSGRGSVYATNSAGDYSSIQLRSKNSNSGIVTTASGGKVTKIVVSWNSNTQSGRTLQVYGKNTAYSTPSDLYSSTASTKGTLLGAIVYGTSTELTVSGDYKYVGLRSADGAMYLDQILVYWDSETPSTNPVINITSANPILVGKDGGSQTATYSITNPVSGQSLTATPNETWITDVNVGSSTITFTVAAQAAGANSRAGTITLSYTGATSVNLDVSQEPGTGGGQAVNGWLELPASTTGVDYFTGTFKVDRGRNYTYLYQYSTYTALWTAYPLYSATTKSTSNSTPAFRPPMAPPDLNPGIETDMYNYSTSWNYNPQIAKDKQVYLKSSYGVSVLGTIYSRGHQIPNGDRKGDDNMQSQTYYFTNSTPQIQNGFNGSIWSALENGIRGALGSDTLYVVTGASFRKVGGGETIKTINPAGDPTKDVPVPNYYWKVILKVKRSGGNITSASAIGFWLEHKQYGNSEYSQYVYSVDKIEEWTGFDFFVNLPASLQVSAEANTNWTTFKNF